MNTDADLIPCISLWRPWADWVMLGWKPIETRTHTRFAKLAGKTIGIHASAHWDKGAITAARDYLTREQVQQTMDLVRAASPGGQLLGIVDAEHHRPLTKGDSPLALIDCEHTTRWGLILQNAKPFPEPIPMRGMQGIWWFRLPKELTAPNPAL